MPADFIHTNYFAGKSVTTTCWHNMVSLTVKCALKKFMPDFKHSTNTIKISSHFKI